MDDDDDGNDQYEDDGEDYYDQEQIIEAILALGNEIWQNLGQT